MCAIVKLPDSCRLKRTGAGLLLLVSGLVVAAAALTLERSQRPPQDAVASWYSSELLPVDERWLTDPPAEKEIRFRLSRQPDLYRVPVQDDGLDEIGLHPDSTYQSLLGIGTSLEATSIFAIRKGATPDEQRVFLRNLVDPETGLGFSFFRISIGTSDFSDGRTVSSHPQGFYSLQDREDEPFSIENDRQLGLIETIRMVNEEAEALEVPITFFASPWSPPPWMKTSGALIGGTLKPGYEPRFAQYFRQFLEAYQAEGIPVHAITIQNEPNFVPPAYPGMFLSWEQERDIAVAAWENFRDTTGGRPLLDTRIWINDHNFEFWAKADRVLTDLEKQGKKQAVDAVAFHNYSGYPASGMAELQARHPDVDLQFTEHSEWGTSGMYNIQSYFRYGSRSYAYWVPFTTERLDEHNQSPYNAVGELSPTLMIRREGERPSWSRTPEYFLLAQFSRFIRPGAVRIGCTFGTPETLTAVAFRNPDGQIVAVVVNQTEEDRPFKFVFGTEQVEAVLPAGTVGTWKIRV